MNRKVLFFPLILGLDILTKVLAIQFIPAFFSAGYPFGGIGIFSTTPISFSLNLVTNTGAAWGILPGHSGLLFALRVLITGFLIANVVYFNKKRVAAFPIWLVITGAIGNQIDYLVYGHVIDFLHFTFFGKSFPIFNIADCCITIGVFALLLLPNKSKVEA